MKTILFQGDSITDAGRYRADSNSMGMGYAVMISGKLGCCFPNQYKTYNRGVDGSRSIDMYSRWKKDCLNLSPDYLSILIGVNDVWHEIEEQNGVSAEKYEKLYDMMLSETKEALPYIKIILMEPFVLRYTDTEASWEYFSKEVAKRRNAVKRLAKKYDAPTVPLQDIFNEALKKAPVSFWSIDGVHPTPAGHGLIAKNWLDVFKKM